MYFPSDFQCVANPLSNTQILFILNTTCIHCQELMDRMVKGVKIPNICILYDTFDAQKIYDKTGISIDSSIQNFPHAILVGKNSKILTIPEMNEIVFS